MSQLWLIAFALTSIFVYACFTTNEFMAGASFSPILICLGVIFLSARKE